LSIVRIVAGLLLVAVLLSSGHAGAHSRWVTVYSDTRFLSEDPGQHQDEIDVEVRLTNYNTYPVRVRCKVEAHTWWYPDTDNDGFEDTFTPENYRAVKWFRTRIGKARRLIGGRDKLKLVHMAVPHPDKGQEDLFEWYGDDHFAGWEHGGMDSTVKHCHGR
jgi:hypothetical protein